MDCQVRSADHVLFQGDAIRVVARSDAGEFAVMEHHAPMLATLPPGPVRVVTPEGTQLFACLGAVLRVSDNAVSISARRAVAAGDIDVQATERRLAELEQVDPERIDAAGRQERDDLVALRDVGRSHA